MKSVVLSILMALPLASQAAVVHIDESSLPDGDFAADGSDFAVVHEKGKLMTWIISGTVSPGDETDSIYRSSFRAQADDRYNVRYSPPGIFDPIDFVETSLTTLHIDNDSFEFIYSFNLPAGVTTPMTWQVKFETIPRRPAPNPAVPLPASLPLLLAGGAAFGVLKRHNIQPLSR